MARTDLGLRVKRRLQGVGFLVVVLLLLGLTIAIYNKSLPWQSSDEVTLVADRAGTQLVIPADVKLEGVLVGRVSAVQTDGQNVRMTLQINPSEMQNIPAGVVARILPKTLFGEKFVDLIVPSGDTSGAHLQPGDVIPQDRSKTAIELQTVFDDLVPLLRTLKPEQLSITLSNVAQALRGHGEELGRNLQLVNQYFSRFNKDLPNFKHDISALADVAGSYANATPDLLAMLRNFSANARTITEKQATYAQFLTGSAQFATTAKRVFGENQTRLIELANVSRPVLDLYAKYSPVLECLPNGLAIYDRTRLEQAFGQGPFLHITVTPVGDRGPYTPADKPQMSDITSLTLPPNCFGLPYGNHGLHPVFSRYPGQHPSDNYQCAGYTAPPTCPGSGSSANAPAKQSAKQTKRNRTKSGSSLLPNLSSDGQPGSKSEQNVIGTLLDPILGGSGGSLPSPGLTDLLMGPMLRGMAVSLK